MQAIFPPSANIVVVGPDANVPQPHKAIVIQTGRYVDPNTGFSFNFLGATPDEHCHQRNDSPLGISYVYDTKIRESLFIRYEEFYLESDNGFNPTNDWRDVPLPLSTHSIADYISQVALHECCHAMGLVPSASAAFNGHNRCKVGDHYMDSGQFRMPLVYLGFVPQLVQRWMPKNAAYLEFVLPTQ